MSGILTYMVFIPLLGGVIILFLKQEQKTAVRGVATVFSFIPVVLSWCYR
jgi:NADH:ubiquinone oxidoreductase subunit 4 (subunit M)